MSTIELRFDMRDVLAMAQRLSVDAAPAMRSELETAMQRTLLPAQRLAVQNAKHDTGAYRRTITTKVDASTNSVEGVLGTNSPYGLPIEDGRKPGSKMPPKGVLTAWMRRHNMDPKKEFVLRRAIARRGIKPTHNLELALDSRIEFARSEFAAVGPRVIQRLVKGGA